MRIGLLFLSLSILLRPALPLLEYGLNYDYIAEVLCINKAKPELHCDGKCYLKKQLAAASETEKPASSDKKQSATWDKVELFPALQILSLDAGIRASGTMPRHPGYRNGYVFLPTDSIFHPPLFIS